MSAAAGFEHRLVIDGELYSGQGAGAAEMAYLVRKEVPGFEAFGGIGLSLDDQALIGWLRTEQLLPPVP